MGSLMKYEPMPPHKASLFPALRERPEPSRSATTNEIIVCGLLTLILLAAAAIIFLDLFPIL